MNFNLSPWKGELSEIINVLKNQTNFISFFTEKENRKYWLLRNESDFHSEDKLSLWDKTNKYIFLWNNIDLLEKKERLNILEKEISNTPKDIKIFVILFNSEAYKEIQLFKNFFKKFQLMETYNTSDIPDISKFLLSKFAESL